MDSGDTIADFQYRSDFADIDIAVVLLDFRLQDGGDFIRVKFRHLYIRFSVL